uniref:Uncharacterized protein n=1 Tax=Anguilla anguilla TaxID=7936 RepID=A0A0E9RA86_ANGAN
MLIAPRPQTESGDSSQRIHLCGRDDSSRISSSKLC